MSSEVMNKEFPKGPQRYAVCESQWKRSKKKSKASTWEETAAEIEKSGMIVSEEEVRIIHLPTQ